MKEQLISFETAKLAKEKGFTYAYEFYDKEGNIEDFGMVGGWTDCCDENYAAPTQSLLAKWLREEHNIHVTSQIGNLDFINTYHYEIRHIDKNKFTCKVKVNYKTYEEAYEIGLQEALKLI